jgi:zinc transporter ZupT
MTELLFHAQPAQAFWFGIISAVSLPIGAILGIWLRPPKIVVSAVMSFGAGSLIAALTLELVDPAFEHSGFAPLAVGLVLGGSLFAGLNYLVNRKGGYLRKKATAVRHLVRTEHDRRRSRLKHLAAMDLMQGIPYEDLPNILDQLTRRYFKAGDIIYRRDDHADSFFFLDNGDVEVHRPGEPPITLCQGASFGTRSFDSETKRRDSTVLSVTDSKTWEVFPEVWEDICTSHPVAAENMRELNAKREHECELRRQAMENMNELDQAFGDNYSLNLTPGMLRGASKSAGGAAVAIWLGIFLDGIPESAVIGASMIHSSVSWALIIGLFMANLPESMSSAATMRMQNARISTIMGMWTSLMLLTGLGALLGNVFLQNADHTTFAVFEGTAAGAMLAMVAETMLPEAYHQGGPIVGMCTLLGFLMALLIKSVG